ncbi:MAG TPA: NAD(P)H-dependent oxidoreductase [Candidatus Hydrogenedens sp.]|nr:NAD(P)H-dependent oxidoreductase [Candidatus Hydrogenedens sp.]HPP58149.1 NAD(P)H-dependent oxidoreductase [Candidatus Hydrogenedens sp.]
MKILSILGSPRKNGNTAHVLSYIEEQLKQQKHEIKHIHVSNLSIEGCRECYWCKKEDSFLCCNNDDAIPLLNDMIEADAIIFSAPTFCWGFPAQMKALLDRMFCLISWEEGSTESKSLLEGKTMALIVTAGGEIKNNAELLGIAFNNMVEFMNCKSAGVVYIAPCEGVRSVNDVIKRQLDEVAKNLIG